VGVSSVGRGYCNFNCIFRLLMYEVSILYNDKLTFSKEKLLEISFNVFVVCNSINFSATRL